MSKGKRLWEDGARMDRIIREAKEFAWREGYYTGKRDYSVSIMGGTSASTPNPYTEGNEK